jgi:hypothetical protein
LDYLKSIILTGVDYVTHNERRGLRREALKTQWKAGKIQRASNVHAMKVFKAKSTLEALKKAD